MYSIKYAMRSIENGKSKNKDTSYLGRRVLLYLLFGHHIFVNRYYYDLDVKFLTKRIIRKKVSIKVSKSNMITSYTPHVTFDTLDESMSA